MKQKKYSFEKPEFLLSLILVFTAAYIFRIGWLKEKWYLYVVSLVLFALAYLSQKKKLNFIWQKR